MALIPPDYLDAVVALGFREGDAEVRWAATGFLYGRLVKGAPGDAKVYDVYLVTSRHVLTGARSVCVRFNSDAGESAQQYEVALHPAGGRPQWVGHADRAVDIAAISVNAPLLKQLGIRFSFFRSDLNVATRQVAVEIGLTEGDGVFVLGFPMGLVGAHRNFVIVRQGVIARIRDALAGDSEEVLIDGTVFPGSSGGPVVTKPEAIDIKGTKAVRTSYLLGIVASYVPYQDVAVSIQTQRPRVIFEENSG